MSNTYIIADIHGCFKTFKKLVTKGIKLKKSDTLYLLGDYIDRGPDSRAVIDFILELRKSKYKVHTLRGNHEQFLLDSLKDEEVNEFWVNYCGGNAALSSFKIRSVSELSKEHLDFFNQTQYYLETDYFFLVHAGLNFSIANPLEDKEAMLSTRKHIINRKFLQNRVLIHGHTPISMIKLMSQKMKNRINLDGGCVFEDYEGLGNLFALNFFERKLLCERNIDF